MANSRMLNAKQPTHERGDEPAPSAGAAVRSSAAAPRARQAVDTAQAGTSVMNDVVFRRKPGKSSTPRTATVARGTDRMRRTRM